MPDSWKTCLLGDFITLHRGYDLPIQERRTGPVPVISSSGKTGTHERAMIKAPGVVTGRYGTIGQVFYIKEDFWPLNTTLYVSDFKGNDPKFVANLLRTIDFQAHSDKSSVPGVNRNHLHTTEIFVPTDISEQRRIADTLSAVEDKIESNRRMNETLEAIARAIFGEMLGDVVESDSEEIRFSEVAEISRQSVNPGENPSEVFEHYSIPAFDEQRLPTRETGEQIKSNKFMVQADSVLLSKLNPRIPRIWLPSISEDGRSICSTEFLVLRSRPDYSREFIYGLCTSSVFQERFATLVTGTSGSHQRVKPEYLETMPIRRPEPKVVKRFTDTVQPLHARVARNLQENTTLASLRDTLLPKLMSGEISVRDGEDAVGAAT